MKERNVTIKRIPYLDALRVTAVLAVMVIHLAATGYTEAEPESYEWFVCWFYNCITRFAVPVFVMISGAMYLDPGRNVTINSILRKIGKLMIVFFGWAAVYALAESLEEHTLFSADYFLSVVEKSVTGHYHMWYLYMIVGLYLATPFLRPVAADRNLLRLFLLLTFLLNHCTRLLCVLPGLGETAQEVMSKVDLSVFSGYAGYYCLGYYLHHTDFSREKTGFVSVIALVLFAAAIMGGTVLDIPNAVFQEKMPHNFVYSAAIFLLFKSGAGWLERSRPVKTAIDTIAPYTLGMYLVHPMFNLILRKAGLYALTLDPLFCIPLCGVLVCTVSFCVIFCMKKLPLVRRFV